MVAHVIDAMASEAGMLNEKSEGDRCFTVHAVVGGQSEGAK
jgi:hypothetical protein